MSDWGRHNWTLEAKEREKNYPGSLCGSATSAIDEKELTGRLAGDTIYTDRVGYPLRSNGAAALGFLI